MQIRRVVHHFEKLIEFRSYAGLSRQAGSKVPVSGIMGKAIIKKNLLGIPEFWRPVLYEERDLCLSRPRSCLGTSRSAWSASRCHAYKSLLKICLRLVC